MAQDMTEKELRKMELDQLKKEVKNERQMISKTGKELMEYIESMAAEDPLLKGIPEDKNPFKEKGGTVAGNKGWLPMTSSTDPDPGPLVFEKIA
uniref:Guanine nucleotide-binding protein subunit gamma n=1 Tax=Crocodylus porosus TaxID=8502 RepID=A0A7M4EIE5_CROPO